MKAKNEEKKERKGYSMPTVTSHWPPRGASFSTRLVQLGHQPKAPSRGERGQRAAPPPVHAPPQPCRPRPRTLALIESRTLPHDLPSTFLSVSRAWSPPPPAAPDADAAVAADLTPSIADHEASPPGPLHRGAQPGRRGLRGALVQLPHATAGSQLP